MGLPVSSQVSLAVWVAAVAKAAKKSVVLVVLVVLVVQRRNGLLLLYAVAGHFEGEGSGGQLTQK